MEQNNYLSLVWIRSKNTGGGCILEGAGEFVLIKPDWTVKRFENLAEAYAAVDKD